MPDRRIEQDITAKREEITAAVKAARRILDRKVGRDGIEKRLGDAYARDLRGGPIDTLDGHRGGGGGGKGQTNVHADPTQTVGIARAEQRTPTFDVLAFRTADALEQLANAVDALKQLDRDLDVIDDTCGERKVVDRCEVCERALKAAGRSETMAEDVHRFTDLDGRLPHPMRLGRACYDYLRRKDQLPTDEVILARYLDGHERERVGA